MKHCKLLLAALGAMVLLGALVSTASAGRLSSSSQTLRSTFREVRFRMPFFTPNCQVTLEGSLHSRTIAKVAGSLIGYINRAILGPCSSGTATILSETLPWHVRYLSFSGTLPSISSIRINVVNASFRIREPFGITCLARSTATEPAIGTFTREAGGALTTSEIGGSIRTTGESCGEIPGEFSSDRGPVTAVGSSTRITVTLI
jgi:hypothetical protein